MNQKRLCRPDRHTETAQVLASDPRTTRATENPSQVETAQPQRRALQTPRHRPRPLPRSYQRRTLSVPKARTRQHQHHQGQQRPPEAPEKTASAVAAQEVPAVAWSETPTPMTLAMDPAPAARPQTAKPSEIHHSPVTARRAATRRVHQQAHQRRQPHRATARPPPPERQTLAQQPRDGGASAAPDPARGQATRHQKQGTRERQKRRRFPPANAKPRPRAPDLQQRHPAHHPRLRHPRLALPGRRTKQNRHPKPKHPTSRDQATSATSTQHQNATQALRRHRGGTTHIRTEICDEIPQHTLRRPPPRPGRGQKQPFEDATGLDRLAL